VTQHVEPSIDGGRVRVATFFLLFLLNTATLAPSLAPSALYWPQLVAVDVVFVNRKVC